jgi:hypothetical protein
MWWSNFIAGRQISQPTDKHDKYQAKADQSHAQSTARLLNRMMR